MIKALFAGAGVTTLLAYIVAIFAMLAGAVTNFIYVLTHFGEILAGPTVQHIVAIIGLVVFPLGGIHGVYLWFA